MFAVISLCYAVPNNYKNWKGLRQNCNLHTSCLHLKILNNIKLKQTNNNNNKQTKPIHYNIGQSPRNTKYTNYGRGSLHVCVFLIKCVICEITYTFKSFSDLNDSF